MKNKIILAAILILFLGMRVAFAAGSVSFSPTNVQTEVGTTFSVAVSLDSGAVKGYTGVLDLRFPSDLVSVKSFSFSDGWMGISQPGYDSINNVSGILVKTAGFPGGFTGKKIFGTAIFEAKENGTGNIETGRGTFVYDSGNKNILESASCSLPMEVVSGPVNPLSTMVIPPAASLATIEKVPEKEVVSGNVQNENNVQAIKEIGGRPLLSGGQNVAVSEVAVPTNASSGADKISYSAALATVLSLGTGSFTVEFIVAVLFLAILAYAGRSFFL